MSIVLDDLVKTYGGHLIVDHVSLDVQDGELLLAVTDDGKGFDAATRPADDWPHYGMQTIRERLGDRQRIELEVMSGAAADRPDVREFTLDTQAADSFTGRFAELTGALAGWRREGFRVRLVASDERQAEHLRQILREHALEAPLVDGLEGRKSLELVTAIYESMATGLPVTIGFGERRSLLGRTS